MKTELVLSVLLALGAGCGTVKMKSGADAAAGGQGGADATGTGGGAAGGAPGVGGGLGTDGGAGNGGADSGTGGADSGAGGGAISTSAVTAGGSVSCALRSNGAMLCWGLNQFGELGDGTTSGSTCPSGGMSFTCRATPAPVVGLGGVVSASAGQWHVCAVKSDGTLWCWGRNSSNQLGHSGNDATCTDPGAGTVACNPTPSQVTTFPAGTKLVQVASGLAHTCALSDQGDVYCWGDNSFGVLGAPVATTSSATPLRVTGLASPAEQVEVTVDHASVTCARLRDTTVSCWGQNDDGGLGHDPTNDPQSGGHPYHAPAPVVDAQQNPLSGVADLAVGGAGACARKTDGTIWCWGYGGLGTLGNGSSDGTVHAPARVVLALPATLSAVARRDYTALALDADGNVWGWGRNNYAMIGDSTVAGDTGCGAICKGTPVKLPGVTGVAKISMGESGGFVITRSGSVLGWGGNDFGSAGHAPNTSGDGACGPQAVAGSICNPTPTPIPGL